MNNSNHNHQRRSFLKVSAAAGGGLILGFHWTGCKSPEEVRPMPKEWTGINAFLQIADNGQVIIMSPNPEIGQNVKTSMPMIIAEEMDVAWEDVIVKQAPFDSEKFTRQVAGGSQSIRKGWTSLRTAGATARHMLIAAAATDWAVDISKCSASKGVITGPGGLSISYADIAKKASKVEIPKDVKLKSVKDFSIIGKSKKNVDLQDIVTGKAVFGLDFYREGMVYASMVRPPAFGQTLVSYDDTEAKKVNGVLDIFRIENKIAVVASTTYPAMKAKKLIKAVWSDNSKLESTEGHNNKMTEMLSKSGGKTIREDGDVNKAIADADQVIERIYEAPFLPHNCLEPMNFFAHVTDEVAEFVGPIQTPQWTQGKIAKLLDRPLEEITIDMTRMGGGFGRRLYGDFALEAAAVSDKIRKPVKLTFTREDDMTAGTYRPSVKYKFRASIKDNQLTGYELIAASINDENATRANNFPCGAVSNYKVVSHRLESKVTTGAWRAPITNFLAYAEQSFLDEVADACGKDPIDFRLALLSNVAKPDPESQDYNPAKLAGVIQLAAEKSDYYNKADKAHKGVSAYYSHNTYVAEIAHMSMKDGKPKLDKMTCAIDCGIVVNPDAANNQVHGGIIDGIGHALYGEQTIVNGIPQSSNFDKYRLIRINDAPEIESYFVQSENDPTGLGEPTLPPAAGAYANAYYRATGKRLYSQPFSKEIELLG